jgi:hypothetical protein
MESSVVDRVYDAFLAALEEQGEVDLAECLRPLLEGEAVPRPAEIADLIARLSEARA